MYTNIRRTRIQIYFSIFFHLASAKIGNIGTNKITMIKF